MSNGQFELGDRVRLSALGKNRMMRKIERRGQVVGFGTTHSVVRVQFDEFGHPVSLHRSYIERDTRADIEARMRASNVPSRVQR
jgi:hypothetical protein